MFSGIVETTARVLSAQGDSQLVRLQVERPISFDDLAMGDSIATNGVCLTVEDFSQASLQFALGPETLRVTGWTPESVVKRAVNLERSLRLNDRVHGHLVTGHVDTMGTIQALGETGETLQVTVGYPSAFAPLVWPKGSVALNGVSLTVNAVSTTTLSVWLIPETLKRTNLGELHVGDSVTMEFDNLARGLLRGVQLGISPEKRSTW